MLAHRVLVIDDEPEICTAVRSALRHTADSVITASTFAEGFKLAAQAPLPDIIVLDLGLPDAEGGEACRELRAAVHAPIIVLTARTGEHEKVRLFDLGADDYITKPFSLRELEARVRVQLRRLAQAGVVQDRRAIRVGEIEVRLDDRAVFRAGVRIALTRIEWKILETLIENADKTFTHRQLSERVWGPLDRDSREHIRFHVTNLRRKIERDATNPTIVITEPGVGYRIESTS